LMLAKVKLTQDIGRWRVEGRTVIHQSWAGYTWRKKGSDLAYYEGCTFPPAPPPPPPVAVTYVVEVRATPAPVAQMFVTVRRFEGGQQVAVHTHLEEGPYPTVEVLFDSKRVLVLTNDQLRVVVTCWFDSIFSEIGADYYLTADVTVPPYNGLEPPEYPGLIHQQTLSPS